MKFLISIICIVITINIMYPQNVWSLSDSLLFHNNMNDTTKLRQFTQFFNSKLARKAHDRLGFINFKNMDYNTAKNEFKNLIKYYKNHKEGKAANYFLGRIATIEDSSTLGIQYYNLYLDKMPNGYWKQSAKYFRLAEMQEKHDTNFFNDLTSFLNEFPVDSFYTKHAQYRLVKYYRDLKDYSNAVKEAKKLLQLYPNCEYSEDIGYQIGDYLYKQNKVLEAKQHYNSIINNNTTNSEKRAIANFLLGELHENLNEISQAKEEYQKVIVENPGITNWTTISQYALADVYYKEWLSTMDSAKFVIAKIKLQDFLSNHPTDKRSPKALFKLANCNFEEGNYDTSISYLDQILSLSFENLVNINPEVSAVEEDQFNDIQKKSILFKSDILAEKLNSYNEALTLLNGLLLEYGNNKEALFLKAKILLELDNFSDARVIFEQLLNDNQYSEIASYYLTKI